MSSRDEEGQGAFKGALEDHARFAAERARQRMGGSLTPDTLDLFLRDTQCLRHPTTIIYDRSGLEPHQFAQPFIGGSDAEDRTCLLHIDPVLRDKPEWVCLAVAYCAAEINYGPVVTPEIAELHGGILTRMTTGACYKKICALADSLFLH